MNQEDAETLRQLVKRQGEKIAHQRGVIAAITEAAEQFEADLAREREARKIVDEALREAVIDRDAFRECALKLCMDKAEATGAVAGLEIAIMDALHDAALTEVELRQAREMLGSHGWTDNAEANWQASRDEIARLRGDVKREHELYLAAHRDNMKGAALLMDMKAKLAGAEKERDALKLAECPSCGMDGHGRWPGILKRLNDAREAANLRAEKMAELLALMDRRGGLGPDLHERIKAALNPAPGKEKKS